MKQINTNILFNNDFGLQGGFSINLASDSTRQEEVLIVDEVLRYLPGKRLACKAQWQGKTVFVKLFNAEKNRHAAVKEMDGYNLLQKTDINTIHLLDRRKIMDTDIFIYDFLQHGKTLEKIVSGATEKETQQYFEVLTPIISRLHHYNLAHSDPHMGNWYIHKKIVYLLDVGSIVNITEAHRQESLALFLAQTPYKYKGIEKAILSQYKTLQTSYQLESDQACINVATKIRKAMDDKFLKKLFRNSSDNVNHKSFFQSYNCKREYYSDDVKFMLNNIELFFINSQLLKDGNASTVIMIQYAGKQFVIKRFNSKTFFKRLLRFFTKSRAENNWYFSNKLQTLNVQVPEPIAMLIKQFGPFKKTSYFISEYVKGNNLYDALSDMQPSDELLNSCSDILYTLKQEGIVHQDMKPTNWLTDGRQVWLFDFDSMTSSYVDGSTKDKDRFLRGWDTLPEIKQKFTLLLSGL